MILLIGGRVATKTTFSFGSISDFLKDSRLRSLFLMFEDVFIWNMTIFVDQVKMSFFKIMPFLGTFSLFFILFETSGLHEDY